MPYSIQSTLQDILNNEQAKAILEKHLPGATAHPDLHMGMHMTLQQISYYQEAVQLGVTQETLQAIDADLKSLG